MKIVVMDPGIMNLGDIRWDYLSKYGDLTVYDCEDSLKTHEEVIEAMRDAEIAVIHQSEIKMDLLEACTKIKYISLTSVGFDMAQTDAMKYARQKGIAISNLAGYGPMTIAQHAMALLLELTNHVGEFRTEVTEGRWRASKDIAGNTNRLSMMELSGKTLGIVGYGKIGSSVATLARAFGMHVLTFSPYSTESAKQEIEHVSFDALLAASDVISLHCPLTKDTAGIINAEVIAKMKDGVLLINTARGGLINEADLADALKNGKIRAAGVDVVSKEPIRPENPLLGIPNCVITPHAAWVSNETRQRMVYCIGDNIEAYLKGNPICVVNG